MGSSIAKINYKSRHSNKYKRHKKILKKSFFNVQANMFQPKQVFIRWNGTEINDKSKAIGFSNKVCQRL